MGASEADQHVAQYALPGLTRALCLSMLVLCSIAACGNDRSSSPTCKLQDLIVCSFVASFFKILYCRLHRTCPGKSKKLDVSCYERAVLVARQPKKEFLCLGMCDVICNTRLERVKSFSKLGSCVERPTNV